MAPTHTNDRSDPFERIQDHGKSAAYARVEYGSNGVVVRACSRIGVGELGDDIVSTPSSPVASRARTSTTAFVGIACAGVKRISAARSLMSIGARRGSLGALTAASAPAASGFATASAGTASAEPAASRASPVSAAVASNRTPESVGAGADASSDPASSAHDRQASQSSKSPTIRATPPLRFGSALLTT